ncbi:hypothetical protein ACLB2K_074242 [Fragaria x ananassa]
MGLAMAVQLGWKELLVESDSSVLVSALHQSGNSSSKAVLDRKGVLLLWWQGGLHIMTIDDQCFIGGLRWVPILRVTQNDMCWAAHPLGSSGPKVNSL